MKKRTLETKEKTKNGIIRFLFCALAIIAEFFLVGLFFTRLSNYIKYINLLVRLIADLLVLHLYSRNRTASMKMPMIMFILIAPLFGVVLYFMIGFSGSTWFMKRRYQKTGSHILGCLKTNEKAMAELEKENPEASSISLYLKNYSSAPLYDDTEVIYFSDAETALEEQIKAISKAKKYIFMEYHAIEKKKAWSKIQSVLEERAACGLDVRIFYDDFGSIKYINTDFVKRMEKLGIKCRVFNPFMPGINFFLNNRDHRKITVIDGEVAFTGGYNLADEYFNYTHPYGQWKDAGLLLKGGAAVSLSMTFLEMWNSVRLNKTPEDDYKLFVPEIKNTGNSKKKNMGFVQPYVSGPMYEEQIAEEVYISMVEKAKKYCWFMTPYLILTDEMSHAIALAAKRGVDVRIITPGIPDKKIIYSVTRSYYRVLARSGVRIYEWNPGFLHAKVCLADDSMATCGTINLDYRSLYHHFENGVFMASVPAIKDIKFDFEYTFLQSREVTEKYLHHKRGIVRLYQMILRLFAELL